MEDVQWYQSSSIVTVSIKASQRGRKAISADINERFCAVHSGDTLIWKGYLAHAINPDKSIVKAAGKRIELKLKKALAEQWEELEDHHHDDHWEKPTSTAEMEEMEVDKHNLKPLSSCSEEICTTVYSSAEDIFHTPSTSPARHTPLSATETIPDSGGSPGSHGDDQRKTSPSGEKITVTEEPSITNTDSDMIDADNLSTVGGECVPSAEKDSGMMDGQDAGMRAIVRNSSEIEQGVDGLSGTVDCSTLPEVAGSMDINPSTAKDVMNLSHVPHDMIDKGSMVLVKVMVPSVDRKSFHVVFEEQTLEVSFVTSNNRFLSTYPESSSCTSFLWKITLFDAIFPEKCMHHVRPQDVSLILSKRDSSVRWKCLEAIQYHPPTSPVEYLTNNILDVTDREGGATAKEVPMDTGIGTGEKQARSSLSDSGSDLGQLNNLDTPDLSAAVPECNQNQLITQNGVPSNGNCHGNVDIQSGGIGKSMNLVGTSHTSVLSGHRIANSSQMNNLSNLSQFLITHSFSAGENLHTQNQSAMEGVIGSPLSNQTKPVIDLLAPSKPQKSTFVRLAPDLFKAPSFTGLTNMGNTCFMSSVVQCLSNTVEVRDYCLSRQYKKDINLTNPLGSQGRLVECFSGILDRLWSGDVQYFAPHNLKTLVASKSDRFGTHAQQDSHEFITFLLDGLHEDVNRVKEKPLTEPVSSNGRPDSEVAEESWELYKKRNDSFFVDMFGGQFKSTLVCPVCSKVSVTFDPFMSMSVPLPKKMRAISVIFFPRDLDSEPKELLLNLPPESNLELLKASVARKTNLPMPQLRIYRISDGCPEDMLSKTHRSIKIIYSDDVIIAYDVLYWRDAKEEVIEVKFVQRLKYPPLPDRCNECRRKSIDLKRCTRCGSVAYCNRSCQSGNWPLHKHHCRPGQHTVVGVPFVISLPISQLTYCNLSRHAERMARFSVRCERAASPIADSGTEYHSSGLAPMFELVPLDEDGTALRGTGPLVDEGEKQIFLPSKHLALDWRNNPKERAHVVVGVRDKMVYSRADRKKSAKAEKQIELEECLELFTEPELLPKDNAWYCPQCKEHREATKQMSVWRLPRILIIHLKRFSFLNYVIRDKIDKMVNYPVSGLDMSPYILGEAAAQLSRESPPIYDLFAVINHYGNVYLGHYTSTVRSPVGGKEEWLYYDDETVYRRIPHEKLVVHDSAYILLYRRRE